MFYFFLQSINLHCTLRKPKCLNFSGSPHTHQKADTHLHFPQLTWSYSVPRTFLPRHCKPVPCCYFFPVTSSNCISLDYLMHKAGQVMQVIGGACVQIWTNNCFWTSLCVDMICYLAMMHETFQIHTLHNYYENNKCSLHNRHTWLYYFTQVYECKYMHIICL